MKLSNSNAVSMIALSGVMRQGLWRHSRKVDVSIFSAFLPLWFLWWQLQKV